MSTQNQIKGNAAEYLVCYELQRRGIPTWQLGGNNKRWDLIFQSGDSFIPIQVKARSQTTVVFKREDMTLTDGYYFIWFTPSTLRGIKNLRREIEGVLQFGVSQEDFVSTDDFALLVLNSSQVIALCEKGAARSSNQKTPSIFTNLTNKDIADGLAGSVAFFKKYRV